MQTTLLDIALRIHVDGNFPVAFNTGYRFYGYFL